MNKGKRGILGRGLQRRLSRRPRALRKDSFRAMEETSAEEIGDREVTSNEGTRVCRIARLGTEARVRRLMPPGEEIG